MVQSTEIYVYIRQHPGANVQEIVDAIKLNRHIVEVATKLMVEYNLICEVGRTEWDDPKYTCVNTKPSDMQSEGHQPHC